MTVSEALSALQLIQRGVTICALVDLLEAGGRRCEIYVGDFRRNGRTPRGSITRLKASGEPLELGRVAYALAHPSSFRHLGFAWSESVGHERCVPHSTYGRCGDAPDGLADITIQGHDSSMTDPAHAVTWIRQQLAAQGVTLQD